MFGRHHGLGPGPFAVAGYGHVAQHIDVGDVIAEMVRRGLG